MASSEFVAFQARMAGQPAPPPPADLPELRQRIDVAMAKQPLAEGTVADPVDAGGVPAIVCQRAERTDPATLVYFHGGGYRLASALAYRAYGTHLARACAARVVLVDYRLAPEHPFPAAVEDALIAYQWVLDGGTPASQVVVAGDSAGGGLTAAVLLAARQRGMAAPAAGVCLSPWVDLTNKASTFDTRSDTDKLFSKTAADEAAALYLAGHRPDDELASPVFGDWTGAPPMLIQVGDTEVLLDDATTLAKAAGAAGVDVELHVYPDMPHVWQLSYPAFPEAVEAVEQIAAFVSASPAPERELAATARPLLGSASMTTGDGSDEPPIAGGRPRPGTEAGPVIVEVRVNEYTMRDANPHVPWSPEEIAADAAACARAGAAIVHFHARDGRTGAPSTDTGLYRETMRRIRAGPDMVVMPTLGAGTNADVAARLAPLQALAADASTRPELAPIDLGSFNLDPYDAVERRFRATELVYLNPVSTLLALITAVRAAAVKPMATLWSVGSARMLGALLDTGALVEPVYAQITLSETLLSTHPGTVAGMRALVGFLPPEAGVVWSVLSVGGDLLPLVGPAVEAGGHVAIGLGDYPYRELGCPTNADLVAEVVRLLAAAGRRPATVAEARAALGLGEAVPGRSGAGANHCDRKAGPPTRGTDG